MFKAKRKRSEHQPQRLRLVFALLMLLMLGMGAFIVGRQLIWQTRPANENYLTYLSDGTRIRKDLTTGIYTTSCCDVNTSVPQAYSPDGKWLAEWHHVTNANKWYLRLQNMQTGKVSLTRYEVGFATLSWSPDSQWVAFGAGNGAVGLNEGAELFMVNVYTRDTIQLTNNGYRDDSPVFSPDGRMLAFTSAADGYNRLYVMALDGFYTPRLVVADTFGYTPSWSPDGEYLAFMSNHIDPNGDIYIVNVHGAPEVERMTNAPTHDEYPMWLPYDCTAGYCYTVYGKTTD